ncbi:FAD-dependent monooxygenase [Streptomyces sp. NPDC001260]|uniref:FAD-dependent monooxygenase n=1 Tax=Streptomyces sp. NPDC001260 TaxID=3364551 RepID=UPI003694525C
MLVVSTRVRCGVAQPDQPVRPRGTGPVEGVRRRASRRGAPGCVGLACGVGRSRRTHTPPLSSWWPYAAWSRRRALDHQVTLLGDAIHAMRPSFGAGANGSVRD